MELLLLVAERRMLAKAFFLSFSRCWNIPVMKLQVMKMWKALQGSSIQLPQGPAILTKVLLKYDSATEGMTSWECLHLNSTNRKLHLDRNVDLSSQCRHTLIHPLRSWEGDHFSSFHSAWGFCFFSFEPSSFHGVSIVGWLSATRFLA